MSIKRGKLIAVEGVEGVGKGTIVPFISSFLQKNGIDVLVVREPGGTPLCEDLRKMIKFHPEKPTNLTNAFLFAAQRSQLFETLIIPHLEKGGWVLEDRSKYTTYAYQGYAMGIPLDFLKMISNSATFNSNYDLVLLIQLSDQEIEKRLKAQIEKDHLGTKSLEFYKKASKGYKEISLQEKEIFKTVPFIENKLEEMREIALNQLILQFPFLLK